MLRKTEFERNEVRWRVALAITVVSGFFVALVFVLLVVNYLQVRAMDPINNTLINELRDQYAAAPDQDVVLAQRIRDLDLLTRKAFFTSQYHLRAGGLLLLVGVVVFLLAFKNMARWRAELPQLAETPPAEIEWLSYATSRHLIAWTGVVLLAGGLLASHMTESILFADATAVSTQDVTVPSVEETVTAPVAAVATQPAPTWDIISANWPSFRGPGGYGVAHFTTAPTEWDFATGKGIRWKAKVPKPGTNSPVVWDKRIYMSGADDANREVYCFDTETGELLWQRTLDRFPNTPDVTPKVSEDTGYAAPTMVAHANQVFAIFVNGDIVSYDRDGALIWGYSFGLPSNHYGHASSLLAYENLLYVQMDGKENPRLMALNVATGEQVWVAQRKKISWASPILAQTPFGPELILCSEEDVDAYDPITGQLLWTQECLGGEVAPSPAYANSIVFTANEYAKASGIQLSATDGAVQSKILWEFDELLPEISSPIGDGERFYFGTSYGDFACLNAQTGEEVWVQELGEGFSSSPVLVGDRVYVLDEEGMMFILQTGNEFKQIAALPTGEPTLATPAYLDGRIYLRTIENLYCIE